MLPGRASRQQQNRDIAAADRQQQSYGAKQQIKGFADGVQDPVAEVLYGNFLVVLWIVIGCLFSEFLAVGLQLCRGGFRLYSGSELDERSVLFAG